MLQNKDINLIPRIIVLSLFILTILFTNNLVSLVLLFIYFALISANDYSTKTLALILFDLLGLCILFSLNNPTLFKLSLTLSYLFIYYALYKNKEKEVSKTVITSDDEKTYKNVDEELQNGDILNNEDKEQINRNLEYKIFQDKYEKKENRFIRFYGSRNSKKEGILEQFNLINILYIIFNILVLLIIIMVK